jgi:hypothetical protein
MTPFSAFRLPKTSGERWHGTATHFTNDTPWGN